MHRQPYAHTVCQIRPSTYTYGSRRWVPSRVPLARIVSFGHASHNHDGSLALMKMLGRNPIKDDEDALKGFLCLVWFSKELIDQAVSVSVLMLDDPF